MAQWVEANLMNQNKMYTYSFCHQPDCYDNELIKLETSLNKIMDINKNNPNPTIIIAGDFNAGDII